MPDFRPIVDEVRTRMRCMGYRPMTEADILPGREAVMVETERYFLSGQGLPPIGMEGTTVIRIDDEATRESNHHEGGKVVFYHCVSPQWDGDCFVGVMDFTRDAFESQLNSDTRYFVKA